MSCSSAVHSKEIDREKRRVIAEDNEVEVVLPAVGDDMLLKVMKDGEVVHLDGDRKAT